ncbi:MAG: GNAT family N-acetyltransferase [Paracoccaceae bacterium]
MTPAELAMVMEATWPPARTIPMPGFTLRDGANGGQRVSAATADADWSPDQLPEAEAAMRAMEQDALFLIRQGDDALDQALQARGYCIKDPVVAYAIPAAALPAAPWMTTFPHWPPMAVACDIWAAGGITAARLAVMDRVTGPKTAILARAGDRASGVAFVAMSGTHAMLHGLEVTPAKRRQGSAQNILSAAAAWTIAQGGSTVSLVVTTTNTGARALYEKCGMTMVGQYHYRILPTVAV